MSVMNVGKPLVTTQLLFDIKELILERSHMKVRNVGKPSAEVCTLLNIREVIEERNHINVMNVGKLLPRVHFLHSTEGSYWRKTLQM